MITEDLKTALKQRYSDVNPLIFFRSLERALTPGEAFDILDSIPNVYPIIWDSDIRRWVHTKNILQSQDNNATF